MKKISRFGLSLLFLLVIGLATAMFLLYRHYIGASLLEHGAYSSSSTTLGTRTVAGDGYAFDVPQAWRVEQNGNDFIAAYPDSFSLSSSSTATTACKVEMSVFPLARDMSAADWISNHIGADPSLAVIERSSESISVNGGSGVKWNGTIDGVPTMMVYIFGDGHSYEITPSVIGANVVGNALCEDALEMFLSQLTVH